jgi:hypothetical protein
MKNKHNKMKMTVFWNVALCILVEIDRRLKGVQPSSTLKSSGRSAGEHDS